MSLRGGHHDHRDSLTLNGLTGLLLQAEAVVVVV